jgi:hypothetical protein
MTKGERIYKHGTMPYIEVGFAVGEGQCVANEREWCGLCGMSERETGGEQGPGRFERFEAAIELRG